MFNLCDIMKLLSEQLSLKKRGGEGGGSQVGLEMKRSGGLVELMK